jgi:RNA polymerase sigma factor (sigma-70 family)
MHRVLRHIRRVALLPARDTPTDAQLLESFWARRDEAAFEALLRRHGPMVLGVCRRVLRHAQDAEDAFQATFLVLARKAGSLHSRELLGNWLYGVAQRTAMKARAMNAKRRSSERRAGEVARPDPADEELLAELDNALSRLPEKYRVPIVLCELEGKSRKDVARQLRIPEGTLSSRLAFAKKLLGKRLARYGAGALVAVLSGNVASACVPPSLLKSTARAAMHVVAGQIMTAGAVSAQVVTLTEGVLKVMFLSKLKTVWMVVLALLVGAGAVGLTYRTAAAQPGSRGDGPPARSATADELEELRLEVAALRKGLEATRQRVRTLESEVQTLKATRAAAGSQVNPGAQNNAFAHLAESAFENYTRVYKAQTTLADPLAEAQTALKKLRANPQDKEAADALDRALQRLKEREEKRNAPQGNDGTPKSPVKRDE